MSTAETSPPSPGPRPTPTEIRELIAWARQLTHHGSAAVDPAEHAAYQAAKTELLARIGERHPGGDARQTATRAREAAEAATQAATTGKEQQR